MNWALQKQIRAGALMAYEAELNTILAPYDDAVVKWPEFHLGFFPWPAQEGHCLPINRLALE